MHVPPIVSKLDPGENGIFKITAAKQLNGEEMKIMVPVGSPLYNANDSCLVGILTPLDFDTEKGKQIMSISTEEPKILKWLKLMLKEPTVRNDDRITA